jgi:lipid A 4'-phosphatase
MRSNQLFLLVFVGSLLLALPPALFPGIDLAVSNFFLQANPPIKPSGWLWVELVNEHIPTLFRALAILCLPAWLIARQWPRFRHLGLTFAFVGMGLLIGPGLMVGALKELTLRARPFHVTEFSGERQFTPAFQITNQCDDNCAFVSGHTSDGFYLATLMLIDRRRRWWWLAAGVLSGGLIGFARVSVGAHWLSDVLWAFPVTLIGSWLAWYILSKLPTFKKNAAFDD